MPLKTPWPPEGTNGYIADTLMEALRKLPAELRLHDGDRTLNVTEWVCLLEAEPVPDVEGDTWYRADYVDGRAEIVRFDGPARRVVYRESADA